MGNSNIYGFPACFQRGKRKKKALTKKLSAPKGLPRPSPTLVLTGPYHV